MNRKSIWSFCLGLLCSVPIFAIWHFWTKGKEPPSHVVTEHLVDVGAPTTAARQAADAETQNIEMSKLTIPLVPAKPYTISAEDWASKDFRKAYTETLKLRLRRAIKGMFGNSEQDRHLFEQVVSALVREAEGIADIQAASQQGVYPQGFDQKLLTQEILSKTQAELAHILGDARYAQMQDLRAALPIRESFLQMQVLLSDTAPLNRTTEGNLIASTTAALNARGLPVVFTPETNPAATRDQVAHYLRLRSEADNATETAMVPRLSSIQIRALRKVNEATRQRIQSDWELYFSRTPSELSP